MTLHTESKAMRIAQIIFMAAMTLGTSAALADVIDGTWKFEKVMDFEGVSKGIVPPVEYRTVQIVNQELGLPPRCFVHLRKGKYDYSQPFQALLTAGVDEKPVADYLQKQFGFKLSDVQYFYKTDPLMSDCNRMGQDILVTQDKLIFVRGGAIFFSYTRSDGGTDKAIAGNIPLYGHKLSHLPFNSDNYTSMCSGASPMATRVPTSTTKCGPVYYPYAASINDTDPLTVLIGSHKYLVGGARRTNDEDYDNPLSNGLHPVFLLLPPVGDVLLVRVDDLETGEKRDGIGGANLAIKNGRVTDQLNVACDWDEQHYCRFNDGKAHYLLLESGKFKKLD